MAPAASRSSSDMSRYSSSDTIYPEDAPYQPSRSALRRRFGNRAIVSNERDPYKGRPGSDAARALAVKKGEKAGFTEEATWRDFFTPFNKPATPPAVTDMVTSGGSPAVNYAPTAGAPDSTVNAIQARRTEPTTYFDEATPFGRSEIGVARSGTNFASRFGRGSVRTAAHMKAGINPPEQYQSNAWDAFLKSPAPAAPPPTSMSLLPSPRQGSPLVSMRTSDFSPTPTADDYYGAILSKPSKFSITTGVLDRLAGPSPWEEPI